MRTRGTKREPVQKQIELYTPYELGGLDVRTGRPNPYAEDSDAWREWNQGRVDMLESWPVFSEVLQ
jgi:hypothetical protein